MTRSAATHEQSERDGSAQRATSAWTLRAVLFIILVGVTLRTALYLSNAPFWVDEAWLIRNLAARDWRALFQPLDYDQAGPIAFLLIENAALAVGGISEFALRFVPWVLSLVTLPLLWLVARRTSSSVLLPLLLFALSARPIRYAAEAKQYTFDLAVVLLLTAVALHTRQLNRPAIAGWSVLGAIAIWFSFPALFVLATVGIMFAVTEFRAGGWRRALRLMPLPLAWGASLLLLYLLQIRALLEHDYLGQYWRDAFMPFDSGAFDWLRRSAWSLQDVAGLRVLPLALFAAFVAAGMVAMLRQRRYRALVVLLGPIACALLLAMLHIYPFAARLVLFSAPASILLAAESVQLVRWRIVPALFLTGAMVWGLATYEKAPALEVRPALRYVQAHAEPGDTVRVIARTYRERLLLFAPVRVYAMKYELPQPIVVRTEAPIASGNWLISLPGRTSELARRKAKRHDVFRIGDVVLHRPRK